MIITLQSKALLEDKFIAQVNLYFYTEKFEEETMKIRYLVLHYFYKR